ncbi:PssD/Cps14F family polysaccharide biosynthesis glycosyltransferase [Priestia aryabhattai]|uniref:PssD/Cps14F family polysaccharide biosynthesis glycosyltransferase n=1 Tax=Priestia aryabhattai TaxID=412384 RepID=UPI003D2D627B
MKVCLISSSGGHFSQLKEIANSFPEKDVAIISEKIPDTSNDSINYYLKQQDRKRKDFLLILIFNLIKSFYLFIKINPDYVISTGAGSVLPFLIIAKFFRKKIIFLESYSKTTSPTVTGRIVYRFADRFYVQWETMLKVYPKAIYKGGIY